MKRSNLGLVYLAVLIIAALLASCSTARVYQKGAGWETLPKKSDITGWTYSQK